MTGEFSGFITEFLIAQRRERNSDLFFDGRGHCCWWHVLRRQSVEGVIDKTHDRGLRTLRSLLTAFDYSQSRRRLDKVSIEFLRFRFRLNLTLVVKVSNRTGG